MISHFSHDPQNKAWNLLLDTKKVNFKILVLFLIRSWSSLVLHPLDVKGSVELLLSSLNHHAVSVPQEQVSHCIH